MNKTIDNTTTAAPKLSRAEAAAKRAEDNAVAARHRANRAKLYNDVSKVLDRVLTEVRGDRDGMAVAALNEAIAKLKAAQSPAVAAQVSSDAEAAGAK